MVYTNTENSAWNALHNGARVPINDTGIEGAPAALGSYEPEWEEGSINKAVFDTHIINEGLFNPADYDNAIAGKLSLYHAGLYVVPSMLYGYIEDSRYKVPGDQMAFRAYPTGIVINHISVIESYTTSSAWDYEGVALDEVDPADNFTIFSTYVELEYKLPYNFEYTAQLKNGVTVLSEVEVRIEAGELLPTHYREIGETTWILLPLNKIFFSGDTTSLSGNQTFTTVSGSVLQEPFYGTLDDIDIPLTEEEYNPTVPPSTYPLGNAYLDPFFISMNCFENVCNEMEESVLNAGGGQLQLFGTTGEALELGASIWLDVEGTIPATQDNYVWANFVYTQPASEPIAIKEINVYTSDTYTHVKKLTIIPEVGFEGVTYNIELYKDGLQVDAAIHLGEAFILTLDGVGIYTLIITATALFKFTVEEFDIMLNSIVNTTEVLTYNINPEELNIYAITQYIHVDNAGVINAITLNMTGTEGCWLTNKCT